MSDKEYARFGDGLVQRAKDSTDDWEPVPADDEQIAAVEVGVAEAMRERNSTSPPRVATNIIRASRNEEIAEKLGLNADQLADRLAKRDENQGTVTRVDDAEFDALMGELGLDPQEARDRFTGAYWE